MRGRKVERRFGWDTHGLPAELEAMRLNGIKTTDEILELGIEKFNEACRASVMKYTGEWRDYVTRQARWVDFDHDYRTYEPDYMESVIWAFKQLYDKGWVYEGFRVLPYCWNDETPLSNHELRMDDDVYQKRQDPAVTVGFTITTDGPLQRRPAARLDDDAVDPAEQPRGDGRRRTSTTSWSSPTTAHRALPPRRGAAARRTPASSADRVPRGRLAGHGRRPARPHLHAAVLLLRRARERVPRRARRRSSPPRTAPGWCTAPAPSVRTTRSVTDREGIEAVMPVGKDGTVHRTRSTDYDGMLVFDANLHIIDHLKAAAPDGEPARSRPAPCCCAARPTTTATRTAGAAASR